MLKDYADRLREESKEKEFENQR